jgi:hypothetical protein
LTHIRAAEANSKLFFLQANGRRRKKIIHSLQTTDGIFVLQEDKEKVVFDHFSTHFGQKEQREVTLNWEELGLPRADLTHLEEDFTVEELHAVIKDFASEKAPGPDGFIGLFFKHCWAVVRQDLMLAINYFFQMHDQHFNLLNSAHVVLVPKKAEAACISDYRPISLTHSFAKIISKLLSTRLAPELNSLVSRAQSAFIRRRSIQDNFLRRLQQSSLELVKLIF